MNTKILSLLTNTKVNDPTQVIDHGYVGNSTQSAGCWIKTTDVNSISSGVIIAIERSDTNNTWFVTLEVNSKQWVRYCCLGAVKVTLGQSISEGQLIGYAYKNLMRVEYCTAKETQFPVRVSSRQLYKTDPTPILFGQLLLSEVI